MWPVAPMTTISMDECPAVCELLTYQGTEFMSNRGSMTRFLFRPQLKLGFLASALALSATSVVAQSNPSRPGDIPLPEHPRPDFQRADWQNLNGAWRFRLDPSDAGARENWQ